MKRYRIMTFDFDSRPWLLAEPVSDSWEPTVQAQWRENKQNIRQGLLQEYGPHQLETKIANFVDFGRIPFSVLAFHNRFVGQIRASFVVGGYYPALTGACALGERILNHLLICLREDFRETPQYTQVYSKQSFDNWAVPIRALEAWGVLLPESVAAFRELQSIRNKAIHFRPDVDTNDRAMALQAVRTLLDIVDTQFGVGGKKPWFMHGIPGELFIAKVAEQWPFVRRIYLPNCQLVGPKHTIVRQGEPFAVRDDTVYEDRDITDEEFTALRLQAQRAG